METQGKGQGETSSTPKDVDKTFNSIKELQTLIKKESALKELCKNTK
jgi:hypothetical protein